MSLKDYIKDQWFALLMSILMLGLVSIVMMTFQINQALVISILMIIVFFLCLILIHDYFRKRVFYQHYCLLVGELDQKYLICEMIQEPTFLEGKILYDSLCEINKSMVEKISELEYSIEQFKDYVEMWIHEVKIPLSHLMLTIHNHKTEINPLILEQVHKLENQIDFILYYTRSQTAQNDYLINSSSLLQMVKNVIKKNKDYFIYHKVKVELKNLNYDVYTDSKWMEFILNQILNNSFQYTQDQKQAVIEISALQKNDCVVLCIEDNGIGIQKADLPRVFDKSFTGQNGRIQKKSTGMGLYICQNLCQQLGHDICIESQFHEYTKVMLTFYNDHYYDIFV